MVPVYDYAQNQLTETERLYHRRNCIRKLVQAQTKDRSAREALSQITDPEGLRLKREATVEMLLQSQPRPVRSEPGKLEFFLGFAFGLLCGFMAWAFFGGVL